MHPLKRLLRSWWKEEHHSKAPVRVLRMGFALALLLLAPLFLLHLRQRVLAGQAEQKQRLFDGLGIVEAVYGSLSRAVLDWGHWDSLYGYVGGSNPNFPRTDIQTTALFDGGMVLLLLDPQANSLLLHAVKGRHPRGEEALVRCARSGLDQLVRISDTVRLVCRDGAGSFYLGMAAPVSNNNSKAPRRGTLVFLDPLTHQEFTPDIRRSLNRFQANLTWVAKPSAGQPLPRGIILPPIHGEAGKLLAFRPQPTWPIVLQVLAEDLLLAMGFGLGFLGFRSILLLERRRQRLIHRRRERLGDARIRSVCHQLDRLHSDLGIHARAASQGSLALARLMRQRQSHPSSTALQFSPATTTPWPEGVDGEANPGEEPAARDLVPLRPEEQDLDDRLQRLVERFQDFLESAQTLALIDPLTQLPNRRFFLDQLAMVASRVSERHARYAVLFVDVDRFKAINDTFGHSFGDALLQAVAQRLSQRLRPGDFLARYGGDELAILMDLSPMAPDSEAEQQASVHRFASRLTDSLIEPVVVNDIPIELSLSVGIALVDPRITDTTQAMQQSDVAMYRAKRHKHDRIAIFDVSEGRENLDTYQLYLDLMQAVRQRQLQVQFQPIVDLQSRVLSVEALSRWRHPDRGWIPPEQFLDLAEQHRQLGALWEAILDRTLQDFSQILGSHPDLHLAINLSPTQLSDASLLPRLDAGLERWRIPQRQLTIEITELAILEASPLVHQHLAELRQRGIRIALDDFGTGHSSLTLLTELRPDEIKIDRSFVGAMESDPYAHHIVALIQGLASNLGIDLVAEGVEDLATFSTLEHLGVRRFQGYWFARPLPWTEINRLIAGQPGESPAPA